MTATDAVPPAEIIVIAEDSAPNRKILGHLLERLGYGTIPCEDGRAALKALEGEAAGRVVLVISDIMMPGLDGLGLLRAMRERPGLEAIPVLLVTAISDKDYIVRAKGLGVNGYILKPITFGRIRDKLAELFPGKVFPDAAA